MCSANDIILNKQCQHVHVVRKNGDEICLKLPHQSKTLNYLFCLRPYLHETFWHTILNRGTLCFIRSLPWLVIEIHVSKKYFYHNIVLSFYPNIVCQNVSCE
jgi:hypothetical protein